MYGNERYEGTEYSFREHVRHNICWYQNTAIIRSLWPWIFYKDTCFPNCNFESDILYKRSFDWSVMSGGSPVKWFIAERTHTGCPRKTSFCKWGRCLLTKSMLQCVHGERISKESFLKAETWWRCFGLSYHSVWGMVHILDNHLILFLMDRDVGYQLPLSKKVIFHPLASVLCLLMAAINKPFLVPNLAISALVRYSPFQEICIDEKLAKFWSLGVVCISASPRERVDDGLKGRNESVDGTCLEKSQRVLILRSHYRKSPISSWG